jgi:hypothetical protein
LRAYAKWTTVDRPFDEGTAGRHRGMRSRILSMPPHRIFAPDADVLARAALLSDILRRVQSYTAGRKLRPLQGCVLFLQARKLGITFLTANIGGFDFLLQLRPAGRALFYRRKWLVLGNSFYNLPASR